MKNGVLSIFLNSFPLKIKGETQPKDQAPLSPSPIQIKVFKKIPLSSTQPNSSLSSSSVSPLFNQFLVASASEINLKPSLAIL